MVSLLLLSFAYIQLTRHKLSPMWCKALSIKPQLPGCGSWPGWLHSLSCKLDPQIVHPVFVVEVKAICSSACVLFFSEPICVLTLSNGSLPMNLQLELVYIPYGYCEKHHKGEMGKDWAIETCFWKGIFIFSVTYGYLLSVGPIPDAPSRYEVHLAYCQHAPMRQSSNLSDLQRPTGEAVSQAHPFVGCRLLCDSVLTS